MTFGHLAHLQPLEGKPPLRSIREHDLKPFTLELDPKFFATANSSDLKMSASFFPTKYVETNDGDTSQEMRCFKKQRAEALFFGVRVSRIRRLLEQDLRPSGFVVARITESKKFDAVLIFWDFDSCSPEEPAARRT